MGVFDPLRYASARFEIGDWLLIVEELNYIKELELAWTHTHRLGNIDTEIKKVERYSGKLRDGRILSLCI